MSEPIITIEMKRRIIMQAALVGIIMVFLTLPILLGLLIVWGIRS